MHHRRHFLKRTSAALAGTALAGFGNKTFGAGANDQVTIGIIGCGGRGTGVGKTFAAADNVRVAYVCDPDGQRLKQALSNFSGATAAQDMRRILDDKNVDAVLITTPDHWHSPAGILACQAGKHAYVEKPCSHNIREGRLLVEAARRNQRIVQHGTQSRSTDMMQQAVQMLREGAIGEVLAAKAWNIQRRGSIGHGQPGDPPQHLDYDQWVGPAEMIPYQANRLHGGWHWWYHFGTGDMGNDGIHDIDYALWGLGAQGHPRRIMAMGGHYFFDDDQQFPDTQQVSFEYPGQGRPKMLIYEQRLWSSNYPFNVDSGAEFYGTGGKLFLSRRGKAELLGERNKKIELDIPRRAQDTGAHVKNFLACVRGEAQPNAEIELGHHSASLCHLGNIATRLGRSLEFDGAKEQFVGDEEANQLVSRSYRPHWGTPKQS